MGGGTENVVIADKIETLGVFTTGKGIAWGVWDKIFRASKCSDIRFPPEKLMEKIRYFSWILLRKMKLSAGLNVGYIGITIQTRIALQNALGQNRI